MQKNVQLFEEQYDKHVSDRLTYPPVNLSLTYLPTLKESWEIQLAELSGATHKPALYLPKSALWAAKKHYATTPFGF